MADGRINPAGTVANATATNATATATVSAVAGKAFVILGVDASFSATPAAPALLQIKDGSTVVWQQYISAPFSREFRNGIKTTIGNNVSAVLAAGGASDVGSVSIDGVFQ